ncbi:MAG: HAD hydrolase-like protein [Planctomycetaceae bacterium]|jgi:phosphoglycolate phosphatase-like HAD superfamily hydrolase|nr:HAD hydrolase-like protein [Planctomycetaceae bacterium]
MFLEIVRRNCPAVPLRAVIFDFDGTVSLIREGWQNIMIPYFVEVLTATPDGRTEDTEDVQRCVRDFVDVLTGKQTIYQCIELAEEVKKRHGIPLDPLEYKHGYHRRLSERIRYRLDELRQGANPEKHLVPGSVPLLEMLRRNGLKLYLASGTDEQFVLEEATLLGVADYFDGGIYGAKDDYKNFSKAMVIQRIIAENHLNGTELAGFGDGYVEIQNVHDAGGFTFGVATDEQGRSNVDEWKRKRLVDAGADVIIPHYGNLPEIERIFAR